MTDQGSLAGPGGAAGFLTALLDSPDEAILAQDLDGIILTWNAAAENHRRGSQAGRTAATRVGVDHGGG